MATAKQASAKKPATKGTTGGAAAAAPAKQASKPAKQQAAPKAAAAAKPSSTAESRTTRPSARKTEPPIVSKTSPQSAPTKAAAAKADKADKADKAEKAVKPDKSAKVDKVDKAAKAAKADAPAAPAAPAPQAPTPAKPPAKDAGSASQAVPPVKGTTKEGIAYTKDFDAKWLLAQRSLLLEEREALTGQATRLEDEANALIEEQEMGDVQFDDEGGEGDTMVVERERDLALSAQARQMVADIDAALERMTIGTYGYSVESGRPIPRERLEAIPWATVLVEEKVGGIGRR